MIVNLFVEKLISEDIIVAEDKQLYIYGLKEGIIILLNLITVVALGILLDMLMESIIFMVTYMPLRSFAGGYHARTQIMCYLSSIVLIVLCLYIIGQINIDFISFAIMILLGIIPIAKFAPLADANKPICQKEKIIFRKKTKRILSVEIIIIVFFLIMKKEMIVSAMLVGISTVGVMIILQIFSIGTKKHIKSWNLFKGE